MATAITYQLDIYNAAGTSVALTLTSISGGTNPYLVNVPTGDGQEFDPLTGATRRGQYTGLIADFITSGTTRVVTSNLEDSGYRQQLMRRKAILKMILDGSTTVVLCAGLLTSLRLVSPMQYEYTVTDRTRIQGDQKIFAPRSAVVTLSASALAGATSLSCNALTLALAKNEELNFGAGKTAVTSAAAAVGATSISVTGLGIGGSTSLAMASGDQATYKESLAAFLARWPGRGCAFGGPIIGGFLGRGDSGGWTMRYELLGGTTPFLRFLSGAGPTASAVYTDINNEHLAPLTNAAVGPYTSKDSAGAVAITTFKQAAKSHFANDLIVEVIGVGYYAADAFGAESSTRTDVEYFLVDTEKNRQGVSLVTGTGLTAGTTYRVRALTAEVSELSPIYYTAHPVDWLTTILTELGYEYDATSMTTVKQAIGTDLRYSEQVTAPENGAAWLADTILGPFGIGLRMGDDGEIEAFSSRIFTNAVPSTTITDADVVTPEEGGAGDVFAISEATAVAAVSFEHYSLFAPGAQLSTPSNRFATRKVNRPDGIVRSKVRIERLNGDPGVVGNREHSWSVNGMVHRLNSYTPANDFLDLAIREIFDRFGRGVIECELPLLRGGSGDALRIGDECIVRLSQLPNKNKRYGDDTSVGGRAMQIVRYTPRASGALVKLLDSGPNAAAYGTSPTLSIAAASGAYYAHRVAELTVTNAATLNADAAGAIILMAVTTAGGSAPAATDYAKVAWYEPGSIPIAAFKLPPVTAGYKVYAKAIATKIGSRPSNASSAVSVALTVIAPVSGVSATADAADGSTATLAWTLGETDHLVDVFVRKTSGTTSADDVKVAELAPGSTAYTLDRLTPSTGYTVSIQHRHPIQNDTSALVTSTVTTAAPIAVLDAPTGARGFVGVQDAAFGLPIDPGIYGIATKCADYPMDVEAQEAVETAVGSGLYGDYATVSRAPVRQGTWTPMYHRAPNDGLRRKLKSRHIRPTQRPQDYAASLTVAEAAALTVAEAAALFAGAGASAFSDIVTVTPYTPTQIQKTAKTFRIGAAQFVPASSNISFDTNGDLSCAAAGTEKARAMILLPNAVTVSGFSARGYTGEGIGSSVTVAVKRAADGSISTLGSVNILGTYNTQSASLGNVIDNTTYTYYAEVTITALSALRTTRFSWIDLEYTSDYLDQSL